jgi:lipopolysaccharide biosynthesis glycosyltransferase
LHDQDALNHAVAGNWVAIDPRWNPLNWVHLPPGHHLFPRARSHCTVSRRKYFNMTRPAVIHFTGGFKPWYYLFEPPGKRLYWRYLRRTPWKDYVPADYSKAAALVKPFYRTIRTVRFTASSGMRRMFPHETAERFSLWFHKAIRGVRLCATLARLAEQPGVPRNGIRSKPPSRAPRQSTVFIDPR